MQAKLHRWAVADPGRRFGDLVNFVYDPATLIVAFDRVAGNQGARTPGVDGRTVADIEEQVSVPRFLEDLRAALKDGSFRPLPVRERKIPIPGGSGKGPQPSQLGQSAEPPAGFHQHPPVRGELVEADAGTSAGARTCPAPESEPVAGAQAVASARAAEQRRHLDADGLGCLRGVLRHVTGHRHIPCGQRLDVDLPTPPQHTLADDRWRGDGDDGDRPADRQRAAGCSWRNEPPPSLSWPPG